MAKSVEKRAIEVAKAYFEYHGYQITDVAHVRGHNGYDLLAERDGRETRVEVKGVSRMWGIPDAFETEFDDKMRLVADFLCVVFVKAKPVQLCVIPRAAIKPMHIERRRGYRFKSSFKQANALKEFLQPLPVGVGNSRKR